LEKVKRIETFLHPGNPKEKILGIRLDTGEVLKDGDFYSSTKGVWEPTPCTGAVIQPGSSVVWVRKWIRKVPA
jgi:hypothetical protein